MSREHVQSSTAVDVIGDPNEIDRLLMVAEPYTLLLANGDEVQVVLLETTPDGGALSLLAAPFP